jgi:glutamine synthetase
MNTTTPSRPGTASPKTIEDILTEAKERRVKQLRLQFVDLHGHPKNMSIHVMQLEKALNNEIMLDGSSIQGFRTIETSDVYFYPDLSTFKVMPWLEGGRVVARIMSDIYTPDGKPFEGCPRNNLRRVLKQVEDLGFKFNVGPELEFFLFKKNPDGSISMNTHDTAGYFDLGPDDLGEIVRGEIVDTLENLGFEMEADHHEVAPGQHEIDFKYSTALNVADNVMTVKSIIRRVAAIHGLHATFMPKPMFGINGSGMHCNMSLSTLDGKNAFADDKAEYQLSQNAQYFIAGILKHIRGITAITNPLVNSYKRLVPGYEAPVYIAWSAANRSALLRVPAKRGPATRVELRSPDPSANPYLAFAALLLAGLDGMEKKIQPPAPTQANIYHLSAEERLQMSIPSLPGSLYEALVEFEKSDIARLALGDHIYEEFLKSKQMEWDRYRQLVTDWETNEYMAHY